MIHPPTTSRPSPGRALRRLIRVLGKPLAVLEDERRTLGTDLDGRSPAPVPVLAGSSYVTHTQYADGVLVVWMERNGVRQGLMWEEVPAHVVGEIHGGFGAARSRSPREFTESEMVEALKLGLARQKEIMR